MLTCQKCEAPVGSNEAYPPILCGGCEYKAIQKFWADDGPMKESLVYQDQILRGLIDPLWKRIAEARELIKTR